MASRITPRDVTEVTTRDQKKVLKKMFQKLEFLTKFCFKKNVPKTRIFDQKKVKKKMFQKLEFLTKKMFKKNVPKTRIFDKILF